MLKQLSALPPARPRQPGPVPYGLAPIKFKGSPNIVHTVVQSVADNSQAQWIYILSAFEYIPSAILSPIMTGAQLKRAGIPEEQRRFAIRQEVVRQGFSIALSVLSFFGGGSMTEILLNGLKKAGLISADKLGGPLAKFLGGMVASTLAYGLLRPILLNNKMLHWVFDPEGKSSLRSSVPVPGVNQVSSGIKPATPSNIPSAFPPAPPAPVVFQGFRTATMDAVPT